MESGGREPAQRARTCSWKGPGSEWVTGEGPAVTARAAPFGKEMDGTVCHFESELLET